MKKITNRQRGFTIIELMIATTIFSLILMICLAGIMQITKMYYRSITQNRTREVARVIIDEISEAVRYSNQNIQIGTTVTGPQVEGDPETNAVGYFCVGPRRYTYAIDRQVKKNADGSNPKQIKHALWVDSLAGCSASSVDLTIDTPTADGKDLLPENMRLYNLSVSVKNETEKIYEISVGVAYGDEDLLSIKTPDPPTDPPTDLTCENSFVGTEFCATTKFLVTVQKRL